MVTGGRDGSSFLDNIEVYGKDKVWKTVSGKLPTGISHHRATTLSGNRVWIFGKNYHFNKMDFFTMKLLGGSDADGSDRNELLEYDPVTEEWQEVGTLMQGRHIHGVSLVPFNHYAAWCE